MRTTTTSQGLAQAVPTHQAGPTDPIRATRGLAVLAAATFVGVTTELLPIGLLTTMSVDLSTSEAVLGATAVTGYALVVGLTATPLTLATAAWPRRRLLLTVLTVYAVSTAVSAGAPNVAVLLAARLLGGLCHGVFWSMVAGYAARLVGPQHVGRATSAVFTGNALAVAVGLPVSTAVGATFGWRATFVGVCVLTAVIAGLARVWLPPLPAQPRAVTGRPAGSVRAAMARPGVRTGVIVTGTVVLGLYTFFSYISVFLRDLGATSALTSAALLAYGVTGVLGTVLLGRTYDRWSRASYALTVATLLGSLGALAALGMLGPAAGVVTAAAVAIALLGGAAIAVPLAWQASILRHAGPAPDAASSLFVAAFNLGISGGGILGALLLLTTGSALLPTVAFVVVAGGAALQAHRARRTPAPSCTPP